MAKAVADVDGDDNTCGFATGGVYNVTGFSHMHDSGTGGQPSLGQFPIFPFIGCPDDEISDCLFSKDARKMTYKSASLKHGPGYFGLALKNGISAEMTVTQHAALYNFQFPQSGSKGPIMLLDLTDLADSRQNATVKVDPSSGRITSSGTFLPSFGNGQFKSYACADFKGASIRDTGVYVNDRAGTYPKEIFVERGINAFYIQSGGFVRFHTPVRNNTIQARVGVSLLSTDQACRNAESELSDWDFAGTVKAAQKAWSKKLEGITITTGGADPSLLKTFYSGLYRNMISPQDYTGQVPHPTSEPYFDSFYCAWDSWRAQHPLLTVVDPTAQSLMLRSLLDTYKHRTGWLPDCRMSLSKGFTQGGSNADNLFADAYVKHVPGINWTLAYEAVVHDAEDEPLDWSNEGRGGLVSWKKLNYIPYLDYDYLGFGTNSRSISRTLEYAYNDFSIAILATALNHTADARKYLHRSGNWRNIFKADQTSFINGTDTGFTGFFQPKYMNGTWGFLEPSECSPLSNLFCSLTSNAAEVFEDSIWTYNFFVPHNQAALIASLGGPATYVKRLDYLHETPGLTDIGNEPTFLTCFLYHYAGRPGLSARRLHTYIPDFFNATLAGIPGNDDSGAMGAFAVLSMMGLFPNPGQNVYLITPPFFEQIKIRSEQTGKIATIRNVHFDAKYKNIYIQSATLNGRKYTKSWIGHEFFLEGGTLELILGSRESSWGTREEDLPPSMDVGLEYGSGELGMPASF